MSMDREYREAKVLEAGGCACVQSESELLELESELSLPLVPEDCTGESAASVAGQSDASSRSSSSSARAATRPCVGTHLRQTQPSSLSQSLSLCLMSEAHYTSNTWAFIF